MKNETYRCSVCKRLGADRAHLRTRGAGGGWEDWEWIPLCRIHHIEQGQIGWNRFIQKYPEIEKEISERGWEIKNEFGVFKLKKKTNFYDF